VYTFGGCGSGVPGCHRSVLSDGEIIAELDSHRLKIEPPPLRTSMQPASVDLAMGTEERRYVGNTTVGWEDRATAVTRARDLSDGGCVVIPPGQFVLLTTMETITMPAHLVGQVHGKSTWGRLGLMVHVTAGLIDPGFHGQITLEARNVGPLTIRICPGDPIAQLTFERLGRAAQRPYGSRGLGSHYQHQVGAVPPQGDGSSKSGP
jgi:dCTP deaminase